MANKYNKFEDEDHNKEKQEKPKFFQKMIENKEKIMGNFITSSAKEEMSKNIAGTVNSKLLFLKKYFDVDINDIKDKLIATLNPMSTKFQELAEKTPDLYGPFWIYATLVFLVAVAGNLSGYINHPHELTKFKYDFNFVPLSAFYIYGIGFGLPILLAFVMKMFSTEISVVLIICYYGYSFTVLGPTLLLCVININILKWLFLSYAIAHSSGFLIFNLWKELAKYVERSRYIIIAIIAFFQLVLLFALKFYFFTNY